MAVLVLSTAAPASAFAKSGSPPLKPFQPSQNAGADQGNEQAVRRKMVAISLQARADHRCGNEARGAGGRWIT